MKFDTTTFKKAAKRYASRHSIPLSKAQDGFSQIIGFNTAHEALAVLAKPDDQRLAPLLPSSAELSASPFWADLDATELRILCECLLSQRDPGSQDGIQGDRSRLASDLLRAVLSDLTQPYRFQQLLTAPLPIDSNVFSRHFALDSIDERAKNLYIEHNGWADQWPCPSRALGRYLESLPRFSRNNTGKRGGQAEETRVAHAYALTGLTQVFDLLSAIEMAGGASRCAMSEDWPEIRIGYHATIWHALRHLITNRKHPTSELGRGILYAAELTELYAASVSAPVVH